MIHYRSVEQRSIWTGSRDIHIQLCETKTSTKVARLLSSKSPPVSCLSGLSLGGILITAFFFLEVLTSFPPFVFCGSVVLVFFCPGFSCFVSFAGCFFRDFFAGGVSWTFRRLVELDLLLTEGGVSQRLL